MYYGCILLLFSYPTWVFKWPIFLPKNSWNWIGYNSNIILWYFDEFFKGVLFLQWVQRCLAQKTKLIFNRFLPQRLRWFSMDFYAESKLIFNRFLREIVNGFLPQKSARFIAQKINWIQFVLLPRKSKEFSSFSWQENDLNWAHFIA